MVSNMKVLQKIVHLNLHQWLYSPGVEMPLSLFSVHPEKKQQHYTSTYFSNLINNIEKYMEPWLQLILRYINNSYQHRSKIIHLLKKLKSNVLLHFVRVGGGELTMESSSLHFL